ncbi:MAG: uroporphyrinogen decarboxylase family protein [Kiritimatiellae bacterium]|nr:uroporphyrinogen decarboxylase family protein [Kiritimatiellia bacterium]
MQPSRPHKRSRRALTHRERARCALRGEQPDFVPHFEIEFQETGRDFGGRTLFGLPGEPDRTGLTALDISRHNARLRTDIAERFDHSMVVSTFTPRCPGRTFEEESIEQIKLLRDLVGDDRMVLGGGDPTYAIPGADMEQFVASLFEEPQRMKDEAQRRVDETLKSFAAYRDAGAEGFVLWSDYAFNSGPFLSPDMFAEFVTPYLKQTIDGIRALGCYAIKHTDGNIMPVIDQIISCRPHALHSLDPMAGMDIRLIKERYGRQVCLIGNVHCAYMQTGTPQQIRESAEYAMTHGKPGGGYIFSTSNCVFQGMPLKSYDLIHAIWEANRDYT